MKNRFTRKSYVYDLIIIGAGAAGMYAAINASRFARVCLITKDKLNNCNTYMAQGGIAAAISQHDSPQKHMQDTILAGYDHCNLAAVEIMVEEAPLIIEELNKMGMPFCKTQGALAMGKEGAHSENRIIHANGDATGKALHDTLARKLLSEEKIDIRENTFITRLLMDNTRIVGAEALSGEIFFSSNIMLATGGTCQVFSRSTNSKAATGDGIAMAFEAGANIVDMEFVQFHPTAFKIAKNEFMLISEALRGEGALLINSKGKRFMPDYHNLAEIAPRDVVSRAILDQMRKHGSDCVYLDITSKSKSFLRERFPSIYKKTMEYGYDLAKNILPVVPAAHYAIGGIETGIWGETNIDHLYACGEAACSGVHGANRLASNSLLESLVFSDRSVRHMHENDCTPLTKYKSFDFEQDFMMEFTEAAYTRQALDKLRFLMFEYAGIYRDECGLLNIKRFLSDNGHIYHIKPKDRLAWETRNMFVIAKLIAESALMRTESRGCHYRTDYPKEENIWRNRRIRNNDYAYFHADKAQA